MYDIVFKVSSEVSLCIPLLIMERDIHLYSAADVFLRRDGFEDVQICNHRPVLCLVDELHEMLVRLLAGDLELHPTCVGKDLGYLYNEYRAGRLKNYPVRGWNYWVGLHYDLWLTGDGAAITRIYSYAGKFFLEITPYYPFTFAEDSLPDNNDSFYDEYAKTYKTIARFELSRAVVEDRLEKSGRLSRLIYENSDRMEREES